MRDIFNVSFIPGVSKSDKEKYLHTIKNEWKYPNVKTFLNEITGDMTDGNIIIMRIDRDIISRLLKKIRESNYNSIEDWLKAQIRGEIND